MSSDPKAIEALMMSVLGSPPAFILNTDKNPFQGGEYVIYAMAIGEERRKVSVRIPRAIAGPHTNLQLSREVEFRRRIQLAEVDLFQPLLRYDSSHDNLLQSPYMILGWAEGRPMIWTDSFPAEEQQRRTVLQAVANASLDMLRVCETGL